MSERLRALFRYNAWANRRTLRAAEALTPDARGEGVTRSLFELLAHVAGTEEGYINLLRGTLEETLAERRAWYAALDGDLTRLRERLTRLDDQLPALASGLREERRLPIPWLNVEVSDREALLQVLVHSIEHRADIATVLTRNGAEAPKLDLVFWIEDGRP